MERDKLTLAGFALIIVIMFSGFALLYNSLSSIRSEVISISRGLEEHGRTISELETRIYNQAEALKGLEEIRHRISQIEASLGDVASASDLEKLAGELGGLSAELKILSEQVTGVNESLRSSLRELSSSIESLSEEVNALAERMLFPTIIVDGVNDEVVILKKPQRIVSLAPSVTETLYFVGAIELLVGVDQWSDFPKIVVDKREKGELAVIDSWKPSVESIVALKPDLVIGVASVPGHIVLKNMLSEFGIPVLLLPDFRLADVVESTMMVGRATGNIVEAYETVYKLELSIKYAQLLASKIESKPRIAAVVWIKPIFVVGGGTWEHDIIEIVGVNAYGDLNLWPTVSPESMLERAPQVIFATSSYGAIKVEDLVNALVNALGDAAYKIPALENGRIYVLAGDYENAFVRPSPRTIIAVYVMLVVLHPQLFDISPDEIPHTISPETLDIVRVLTPIAPDPVVELVKSGLAS